ncbi:MAG: hypothetical protein WCJ95_23105 [Mariniphaga sp.]
MWKRYFKFIKLKPGKVVTAQFGEIDFSADSIGIEIIQALYENGFPYLEITAEGQAELYGGISETEESLEIRKPRYGKKAKTLR